MPPKTWELYLCQAETAARGHPFYWISDRDDATRWCPVDALVRCQLRLPPGWASAFDTVKGVTYYYVTSGGNAQWTLPDGCFIDADHGPPEVPLQSPPHVPHQLVPPVFAHPLYGDGQFGQQQVQTSFLRLPSDCARLGVHSARKLCGAPLETQHGIGLLLPESNRLLGGMTQNNSTSLIDTLFAGWWQVGGLQVKLVATAGDMEWFRMRTGAGYQAWTCKCKHCGALMEAAWRGTSSLQHRRHQQSECLHFFQERVPADMLMTLESTLPTE